MPFAESVKLWPSRSSVRSQCTNTFPSRSNQIPAKPQMNPAVFAGNAHSEYKEGTTLVDMLKEDLIAERIAIESYRDMVRFFGDKDTTTRRMLEQILAKEEEHADDLADLLFAQSENGDVRPLYYKDEVPQAKAPQPGDKH